MLVIASAATVFSPAPAGRPRRPCGATGSGSTETAEGGRAMRVGLVTPYSWTVPGGVNHHIEHLAAELEARGHEPWIIAPVGVLSPTRRAGFVHVQDVEASVAHGAIHAQHDSRIDADVGARAVGRQRDGRTHGDEAFGGLLPPAAVHGAPGRRENAHGGDDPGLVTARLELGGQMLDVMVDAARHGP